MKGYGQTLALVAKCVAPDSIGLARINADKPNEWRKIGEAEDLLAEGEAAAAGSYMEAAWKVH